MMTNSSGNNNNCDDDNEPFDIFCNMMNANGNLGAKESAKFGAD